MRDHTTPEPPPVEAISDRLRRDEERLWRDERRLDDHDVLLAAEEEEISRGRLVVAAIATVLLIAIAGLVIGVVALNRDVDTLARRAPDGSVSTTAIQPGAVTAAKLAHGAVSGAAIRTGAVGTDQLASGAVTDVTVARDALTGAAIAEPTLARVPAATRAARARAARRAVHATTATRAAVSGSADRLAGVPAAGYLSKPTIVHATTPSDTARDKGPLSARCPTGMHVLSGGVAVYGDTDGVTILRNVPAGAHGWAGLAHAGTNASREWRLVVRAVCVQGGA